LISFAALGIALAPAVQAYAQQVPADTKATSEQDAEKSCNYDLDHDRFGSYGSMEECVTARSASSERAYIAKSATTQARTAQSNRPN
jgi:hypothetical protein